MDRSLDGRLPSLGLSFQNMKHQRWAPTTAIPPSEVKKAFETFQLDLAIQMGRLRLMEEHR